MKKILAICFSIVICFTATAQENLLEIQKLNAQLSSIQKQLDEIQALQQQSAKKKYLLNEVIPSKTTTSNSHFFWGMAGGVFFDFGNKYSDEEAKKEGSAFSFAIKPRIGFYLNEKWAVGVIGEFSYSNIGHDGTIWENISVGSISLRNIISSVTLGSGIQGNSIAWKVLPYVRYKATNLFSDKLNLWIELNVYAGQRFQKDDVTKQYSQPNFIYGAALSPMLSYDLNENMMLTLMPDFIRWEGSQKHIAGSGNIVSGAFSAQMNPLFHILSGVFNIGIIKRF